MKFTLRDIFWLIAVVAILLAWLLSYRRMVADHEKAVAEKERVIQRARDTINHINMPRLDRELRRMATRIKELESARPKDSESALSTEQAKP